jgi:protein-tyrosine phosphatase
MDRYNMRNMERICGGDPQGKLRKLLSRDVADPWYTGNFEDTYADVLEGCTALLEELRTEIY